MCVASLIAWLSISLFSLSYCFTNCIIQRPTWQYRMPHRPNRYKAVDKIQHQRPTRWKTLEQLHIPPQMREQKMQRLIRRRNSETTNHPNGWTWWKGQEFLDLQAYLLNKTSSSKRPPFRSPCKQLRKQKKTKVGWSDVYTGSQAYSQHTERKLQISSLRVIWRQVITQLTSDRIQCIEHFLPCNFKENFSVTLLMPSRKQAKIRVEWKQNASRNHLPN